MRRLVWLAIGLAGGCAIGAYAFQSEILLPLATMSVLAAILLLCFKGKKLGLVCLSLAAGIIYTGAYSHYYFDTARQFDNTTQSLSITSTAYSEKIDYGIRCEGEITLSGKTYAVYFYGDQDIAIAPGDVVEGEFLLRATTPGSSKESAYHQGNALYFIAYDRGDMTLTPGNENHIRYLPQRLARTVLQKIEKTFPEDTRGFAKALLFGDTDGLTYAQDIAFQVSGIRHIVAVSGLHVSILFALIFTLSGKKRYLTAFLGIPALILFAFMAGLSPSIVRACVMQSLMILALLFRREYDPPSALAFAVMVILGSNPFSIVSVSFQLSCGCIVGIFLFSGRLQKYIYAKVKGFSFNKKVFRATAAGVSVTIGTMIVTAPLCALYFESVSLVGILTNLLTLWAVSIIFYGIVAVCLLSFLYLPLAGLVASVISVLMRYVLLTAELLSKFPLSAVYTASPYIVLWLILCYGLFLLFWLQGKNHPVRTVAVMAALLIFATAFSYFEPRLDNYRITVLDVGQGQCILLQSKGETYLVDCGGSSDISTADIAAKQLLSQGIRSIDGVILTHYDTDHMGALSYFLQRIEADVLYLPKSSSGQNLDLPAGQKTVPLTSIREIGLGVGKITLIPGINGADDNENSTCVLFQTDECAILITGDRAQDGEDLLLQQIELPKLDYLLAGHHGASSSTNFPLLAQTRPDTVLISVGENQYDHPHSQTLERLEFFGCKVLRTDINGTIIIRG